MVADTNSTDEAVRGAKGAEESAAAEGGEIDSGDRAAAKQVVKQVLDFVQEQPWLAVAGAFVLGYLAAQLVKRMD
jgi:ElaB/YqjD/DUF883 family membrane-anchored ribosome-binding protein